MALLVGNPSQGAIEVSLSRMLKTNFKLGKWPASCGLVSVVSRSKRGSTVDFYADAPGAFSVTSLPDYAAIVAAATPRYAIQLDRIRATPGISIWSESDKLMIGTASPDSDVFGAGRAVRLDFKSAVLYWLAQTRDGKCRNGTYPFAKFAVASQVTKPWLDATNDGGMSFIAAAWLGIYRHSGGTIRGVPFLVNTLQEVHDLAVPGSTVMCATGGHNGAAFADSYYLDGEVKDQVGGALALGQPSTGSAYCGYVFPSIAGESPVLFVPQPILANPSQGTVAASFLSNPIVSKGWSQLNRPGLLASTSSWASLASMWPATPAQNVPYLSGAHNEQRSPVRALPQISSECGLRALVYVADLSKVGHYQFTSTTGVNVKVVIVDECDQYSAIPLTWLSTYVAKRVLDGGIDTKKQTEIEDYVSKYPDAVVQVVEYASPVILEKDLVMNTEVHRRYKKAREKNCKVDNFASKSFTETMTYGALNTKINGSLSTREFYSLSLEGEIADFTPRSGRHSKGAIAATKVNSLITTVVVSGTISGAFSSTSPVVGEAYIASYSLSGCTEAELLAWLGPDAVNLPALKAEAQAELVGTDAPFVPGPKVNSVLSFEEHALKMGNYPDFKRLNEINAERARSLAMVSKGAILVGPTLSKLLFESRELK